jgi:hypothetical protein
MVSSALVSNTALPVLQHTPRNEKLRAECARVAR